MRILVVKRDASEICARISERFPNYIIEQCGISSELPSCLSNFRPDVALTFKLDSHPFPKQALMNCPSLKWVHTSTTGVDHLLPFDSRIQLTNSANVHDEVLANYVIGSILIVNTHFMTFREQQERTEWKPHELIPTSEQKLAVIGFGRIGSRIGRVARGLGMTVTGVRTQPGTSVDADRIMGLDGLHEAVEDADFVAVTLPLTPRTSGLINDAVIQDMRRGAWVINISRGGIVDEDALRRGIESEHLGGAFMDVFSVEPLPPSSKMWSTKNLFITPHTGDVRGWQDAVCKLFCDNLQSFSNGRPLQNIVEAWRGY